jgi:hypothetical protein
LRTGNSNYSAAPPLSLVFREDLATGLQFPCGLFKYAFSRDYIVSDRNIVTWRLKAGIVEPERDVRWWATAK